MNAPEPKRTARADHFVVTRDGKPYVDADGYAAGFDSLRQRLMERAPATTALKTRFTEKDPRAKVASDAPSLAGQAAADLLLHTSPAVTDKHYRRGTKRLRAAGIGRTGMNRKA